MAEQTPALSGGALPLIFTHFHLRTLKLSNSLLAATFCTLALSFAAAPAHSANNTTSAKKSKKAPSAEIQANNVHFSQWKQVSLFIADMAARYGFQTEQLNTVFDQARYIETARQLMKPAPPGKPKNWKAYRARFVEPYRIDAGVAFWDKYSDALDRAQQQYGVPPEIIVGLIGVESIFGKHTGNFRVMDVLTTLAFDYPDTPTREARMQFFRSELENMLLMARDSGLDPFSFKGSYAGAIGWPQFMPGSIRKYAVDFDGDGVINLTDSPVDAIGSVAHYLSVHGWKRDMPVAFPATLINGSQPEVLSNILSKGLQATYQLRELKSVVGTSSADAPDGILYGLADLQNGEDADEYWLVTDNFYAITHYNRSYFYAMSVFELGRVIRSARSK